MCVSCKQYKLSNCFIYFNQPHPEYVQAISLFAVKSLGTFEIDAFNKVTIFPLTILLNLVDTMEVAIKDIFPTKSYLYK